LNLKPFQIAAAAQIARRFLDYMEEPLLITKTKRVPFFQLLSALTGSGKTLILAEAIVQIRAELPIEPVILWVTKSRVIVDQTLQNMTEGKYSELLSGFHVKSLPDCKPEDVERADSPLLLLATVGKFNRQDKEKGDRKVFQIEFDFADRSLWEVLKRRQTADGYQRPLLIVYDEGHNLSDQQTELLLELGPDALIAASATMRLPKLLSRVMERLRNDGGWQDEDFVTSVRNSDVVQAGLIKRQILIGGYITPMEAAIDEMLLQMKKVEALGAQAAPPVRPKAIYVSHTNRVSGEIEDDVTKPFAQRTARPILIWRYLVEHHGIPPQEIAVYCNLRFHREFPPPAEFRLFSGGDADFEEFQSGNYRHIIFNLSLQEGWDDPSCYFAYVDKDMGSKDQITQIIGRVLRQPGAAHYQHQELNTAHFYIRTDEKSAFEEVLQEVKAKVAADTPELTLTVYKREGRRGQKPLLAPRKERLLPTVVAHPGQAQTVIQRILDSIHDYREDKINTIGTGSRKKVLQTIGQGAQETQEWVEMAGAQKVTARYVLRKEIERLHSRAVNLCSFHDPKLNALIEYHSRAHQELREAAQKVVKACLDHTTLVQTWRNAQPVGEVAVEEEKRVSFQNALHEAYEQFNTWEDQFAKALDQSGWDWMRNPAAGGFAIPLNDLGATKHAYFDFLVWTDDALVAIDTKGEHLIREAVARKLFHIETSGQGPALKVRLVTEGEWNAQLEKTSNFGCTVWLLRNGRVHPICCPTLEEAVQVCVLE
jgi:type III restriction enzyme